MDAFRTRISIDETANVVESALAQGILNGAPAAIFHDLGLMRARIGELQTAFPATTLHAIAIKANPVLEILREAVACGCGLEAASLEEVQLALAADCPPERIIFDSPAKTIEEIRTALAAGVYVNADNLAEIERIAAVRETAESDSVIGLRVNPQVGGGTISFTSVAQSDSKFGVPLAENRDAIVAAFRQYDWLTGLHVHVGSQGCELEMLADAVVIAENLRAEISRDSGRQITHLDIGGGLPTVYVTGRTAPTPAEYVARLAARAPGVLSPPVQLITEFGRAVQANCGFAASRVEYFKAGQDMAVVHVGADFLVRPVYRPDDWPHEFFVLNAQGKPKTGAERPVTIAGPLCFGGDILARQIMLPPIETGDWLVIRDVGAYTLSMWSRHCSRGTPAVVGYSRDSASGLRVLRRAETPADIVRYWSQSAGGGAHD